MKKSRLISEIHLSSAGYQRGFIRLPLSSHESAYGWLPIPIVSIKRGEGACAVVIAGNHGDEYEGQIVASRLCRELKESDVFGQLIILPTLNWPAAMAGLRVSPIDNGNLNRSFPGDPDGTPTSAIAFFVETEILPRADLVIDLHSGGSSLNYIPSALVRYQSAPEKLRGSLALLQAFGAPIGYVVHAPPGEDRTLMGAADRLGISCIGTELGGGGTTTVETCRIGYEGVLKVLDRAGIIRSKKPFSSSKVRFVEVGGDDYYVFASENGVFEPAVELSQQVKKNQLAGLIHTPETPWKDPEPVYFNRDGFVLCGRVPSLTRRGDCLFHLGTDLDLEVTNKITSGA